MLASISMTILMANYNNASYIQESITSVVQQTSPDWRLLICDDASTDDSLQRIANIPKDPRIRLLINPVNSGYIRTLKRLIAEAETEILGILDSDDALMPEAVPRILAAYQRNGDAGFVYSSYFFCDKKLKPFQVAPVKDSAQVKSTMHNPSLSHFKTFKKSVYLQTTGYDDSMLYAEDKDLIYKMEEATPFVFVNQPLYRYRILRESQSHSIEKRTIGAQTHIRVVCNACYRRRGTLLPHLSSEELFQWVSEKNRLSHRKTLLHRLPDFLYNKALIMHLHLKGNEAYASRYKQIKGFSSHIFNRFGSSTKIAFFVCHSQKFMFINISKCATTYLKSLLIEFDYHIADAVQVHNFLGYQYNNRVRIRLMEADQFPGFVKFAVYRDPVERFQSLYAQKILNNKNPDRYFVKKHLINSSVNHVLKFIEKELKKPVDRQDNHIRPQSLYYHPHQLDFIVPIEKLALFLQEKFGIKPRLWRNTSHSEGIDLTDEQSNRIKDLYEADYELEKYLWIETEK
jgi:glycosyltransferase involved in cell wall biosynthesis